MPPGASVPPDVPDLLGPQVDPGELIAEEAPWFGEAANTVMAASIPFVRSFFGESENYPALATIFNQGFSDLQGLLIELSHGNGRSAVRSARSLIEHAVNIRDIESSPSSAARYLDHLSFGLEFANDFELGLNLLKRGQREKISKQRAHALRKAQPELEATLKKYGSKFRSGWSDQNLRDRSSSFGLSHLYPAYRLTSLIIHGASGGILGLVRDIHGHRVHRTGVAVHLCPFAYIAGMEAAQEIAATAGRQRPDIDVGQFLDALAHLKALWPQYLEAANKVDKRIWPRTPPRHATAIVAVSRDGRRRWYWYDPETEVVIEANAPSLTADQEQMVANLVATIINAPDQFIPNGLSFATVCFEETVVVTPKPEAPVLHATAVMLSSAEARGMNRFVVHPDGRVDPW